MSYQQHKNSTIFYWFLFGIAIILLLGGSAFIFFRVHITTIPLLEQTWKTEPGFIAVEYIHHENPYLAFYRLKDAKEEKLPGVFNYYFVDSHEAIVYGFMNDSPITQYFFVLTDFGGFIKNISTLPGRITAINQNKPGTHLLIEGIRSEMASTTMQSHYTCLAEKNTSDTIHCKFIPETILEGTFESTNSYHVTWHNDDETLLAIQELGSAQRKFYYDVITKNLSESEPKESKSNPVKKRTSPENMLVKKLPFVTFLFNKTTNQLHVLWIDSKSAIRWVDQSHLLILEKEKSYIYNLTTREKSPFIDLPPPELRIINVSSLLDQ